MTVDVARPGAATHDREIGAAQYRYPGSPPFRDTELDRRLFRGRAQEADIVLHSILSTNLFLLYAASGLGKTSLLNAGVMHELRGRAHWPVSVRLNDPTRSPVEGIRERIEAAAASDPDVDLVIAPDAAAAEHGETLWDLLTALEVWRGNELQQPVLILDQFEELFTLDWDEDVRSRFIEQFGQVVRGHRSDSTTGSDTAPPDVRFVLVIREDSLGELDALAADVPQIMRNRFRLGALDPRQAEAAVLEPAQLDDPRLATERFEYTEAAAREILEFLRTEKQRGSTRLASSVDPSQLQIVCQYVEQAILPGKAAAPDPDAVARIDAPDLGGREGLDRILSDFYRRTIESLPSSEHRAARNLCEDGLINRSGRRLSLEQDEIVAGFDVTPTTLQALVDGRLLRADPRVGSVYYELSHDTLVGPIRAYRDEQRALQRRRRNRVIGIAAAVIAVVAVGVAIAIAAGSESSDSAVEPAIELAVGDVDVEGAIEQPGSVVRYRVDADATDPLVVVVEPEAGLNAVIDVTTLNEARVTRQVDQYAGGAERMVIPPVPEGEPGQEIRVTSFDSTVGSFAISVEEIEAIELTSEDDERAGSLSGPDSLAVYRVETSADVVSSVTVTPATTPDVTAQVATAAGAADGAGASAEQKPLDIEVEVIGPTAVGRRFDAAGPREAESVTLGEPTGVHYVVVRPKDGTTGPYEVELESSMLTMSGELTLDESVRGVISSADEPAEFTFTPPDVGPFAIEVLPDRQFDAVVEVESSDTFSGADSFGNGEREVVFVEGSSGPYDVRVSGWEGSTGGFEIGVSPLDAISIAVGEQQVGSDEQLYEFDVEDGAPLAFTVRPTSGDFAQVEVTDGSGNPVSNGHSLVSQGDAVALIDGPAGTYRAVVQAGEGGDFTAELSTVEAEALTVGQEVEGSGFAVYRIEADDGFFGLVVEPASSELFVEVEVLGPDGSSSGGYSDGDFPAQVQIGPFGGTYTVIVRPDGDAVFTSSLTPIEGQRLAVGDVVGATGDTVFVVDVTEGEFYELVTDPAQGNEYLEVEVRDPDGVSVAFGFGEGGEPAVATFGGRSGTFSVFVRGAGSGEHTSTLAILDPEPLTLGAALTVERTTVFELAALEGVRYVLTADPQAPDTFLAAELLDDAGFVLASDYNADAGETLESEAVAPFDGTFYLIVRIFGDDQVAVSLAENAAE